MFQPGNEVHKGPTTWANGSFLIQNVTNGNLKSTPKSMQLTLARAPHTHTQPTARGNFSFQRIKSRSPATGKLKKKPAPTYIFSRGDNIITIQWIQSKFQSSYKVASFPLSFFFFWYTFLSEGKGRQSCPNLPMTMGSKKTWQGTIVMEGSNTREQLPPVVVVASLAAAAALMCTWPTNFYDDGRSYIAAIRVRDVLIKDSRVLPSFQVHAFNSLDT